MGKHYDGYQDLVFRCTDIYTMGVIGGKWRLPIIWVLSWQESMRYNEIKRELDGITNIMLTRSLQGLEEYHLIVRTEYPEVPLRVEYSLTDKCRELLPTLEAMNQWGKEVLADYYRQKQVEDKTD